MCSILELQQYPLLHYMPKMISRFSKNTINAIGYYVYGLRYPREQEYFYIGKGKLKSIYDYAWSLTRLKSYYGEAISYFVKLIVLLRSSNGIREHPEENS